MQREIAREVPGFGGYFFDRDDRTSLNVWVVDPAADAVDVAFALRNATADHPAFEGVEIQLVKGQYGYLQIQEWYDRVAALVGTSGVTYLDNQEALNRLQIGLEDSANRASVEKELNGYGVPLEAVAFEVTGTGAPASLRTYQGPLVGGIQVTMDPPGLSGECSLGFVGIRASQAGFVSASHCTGIQVYPGVQYTEFNQPLTSRVGEETADPATFTGTGGVCPEGEQCRFSEAAWVKCDAGISCSRGYIANPATYNNANNWNGVDKYKVTHEYSIPGVYAPVTKVGRTTGETTGFVTNSCILFEWNDVSFICQHRASFAFDGGDSGSPVFAAYTYPYLGPNVHLYGMAWYEFFGVNAAIFSDINYMQFTQELGNITVIAP